MHFQNHQGFNEIPSHPPIDAASPGCIYAIPCSSCNNVYVGETGRQLQARLEDHPRSLGRNDLSSALVQHRNRFDHNFLLRDTITLARCNNPTMRKAIESAAIRHFCTVLQRLGYVQLNSQIAYNIVNDRNLLELSKSLQNRNNNASLTIDPT